MRKGGEPRHAWLRSVSFAVLLEGRVDLCPEIFVTGLRSKKTQSFRDIEAKVYLIHSHSFPS